MRKLFCYILFFPVGSGLFGQNPVSRNLTILNGLPSNTIYHIIQDKQGFIWLGHDKGLSRYDGNHFTHYATTAQQGKSISNLVDLNNNIWCQDFSGNFYHTSGQELYKEKNYFSTGGYSPAGAINASTLVSVKEDSLRIYDTEKRKLLSIPLPGNSRPAICFADGKACFFSGNKLYSYDAEGIKTLQYFNGSLPQFYFLIKSGDAFYAFTRNSPSVPYRIRNNVAEALPAIKNQALIQDVSVVNNEIWVSTTSGAYCYNSNMEPLYKGQCFFSGYSITRVIKDKESNYWFGTINKGLLFVPDITTRLYKYGGESVTALCTYRSANEILAGTSSNLIFTFNTQTEKINTIISDEARGEIFSLFYDKKDNTIVSCASNLAYYKNEKKVYEKKLASKSVSSINDNTYAIAYSSGILLLPKANKEPVVPVHIPYKKDSTGKSRIVIAGFRGRSVLYDTAGQTLFAATAAGLQQFSPQNSGTFIMNNGMHVYASGLAAIRQTLFAATFTDGLFEISNGRATSLNEKWPCLLKTIYKIYATENSLWLTGDEIVQRLNIETNSLTNYTTADGMPVAEIKDILSINGKVFVATTDGLVVFDENKNSINNIRPTLIINKILVNEKERLPGQPLALQPAENNIKIEFSLLTYKGNPAAVIEYRVNEDEWQRLPAGTRTLPLPSLAPGTYTVEINAFNEDGIAVEEKARIHFTIAAPFYKQWWFISLAAAAVILVMYFYFRLRLNHEKRNTDLLSQKIQLEQELHQSMLSSIKSQMNPHFLFNALNTVQSYIYTNEKENASAYLGKFSELTRMILEMSNKETVSLADEVKALKLYLELEALRFENKLHYTFNVDGAISAETTFIPSMLIQPYIENAVKHGLLHSKNPWKLTVRFTQVDTGIEVLIIDNGIGRKRSEELNKAKHRQHRSFAASANQKRLEILNKGLKQTISLQITDKEDEYGNAGGTEVLLHIPFSKEKG